MDTLIDNRQFPQEMQQDPEFKEDKKSTPWLLILLVVIAVGIIVFLLCNIFVKKNDVKFRTEGRTYKEKIETINRFNASTPEMTIEERQKRVDIFFNK